jgi:hypothetical protein
MGNQAGTVVDLINGEDDEVKQAGTVVDLINGEDDEVKAAVTGAR